MKDASTSNNTSKELKFHQYLLWLVHGTEYEVHEHLNSDIKTLMFYTLLYSPIRLSSSKDLISAILSRAWRNILWTTNQ